MLENTLDNEYKFESIGTGWIIETKEPLTDSIKSRLHNRIDLFDKTYSRFRSDSLVASIASATDGGLFKFPNDSLPMFDLYDMLHKLTGGKVDPLIGAELKLLGYDAQYSLQTNPRAAYFNPDKQVLDWTGDISRRGNLITTDRPLTIDVGAAGKGYLVDIISGILINEGITEYLIDGSGDIRHAGNVEVIVGLEHPANAEMVIGTLPLKNQAICASATNRRKWGNGLHHVLDGRTGRPVQDVVATWAIAETALLADGLATALFFVNAEKLKEQFLFSSVRIFSDMRVEVSDDFEGTLFTK
ncbi:FAD:protein FMN transferase [Olivibacter sp. XZL3]|uniref:FAD:protein FMN transferase n=1 Tax=Olivibacter sp. XZL3 TaxID=1735116 RepID=UPI0010669D16|nr:FAD:protein FMN transferase [Olivibacter sp. XZL3]